MATTSRPALTRKQQITRSTIFVVGSIVVLAMVYGSGMRGQGRNLKALNEQYKITRSDLRLAQLNLQARDALIQQLEARRQVGLAAMALQSGDTATAHAHLNEATKRLQIAADVQANTAADMSRLTPLLKAQSTTPYKQTLLSLMQEMDAALAKVVPTPDAVTRVTIPSPNANDVPATPGHDVNTTELGK